MNLKNLIIFMIITGALVSMSIAIYSSVSMDLNPFYQLEKVLLNLKNNLLDFQDNINNSFANFDMGKVKDFVINLEEKVNNAFK